MRGPWGNILMNDLKIEYDCMYARNKNINYFMLFKTTDLWFKF